MGPTLVFFFSTLLLTNMGKVQLKPQSFAEFFAFQNFKPPKGDQVVDKVKNNVCYFAGNYLCVVAAVCVITSLFYRPFVVFLLVSGIASGAAVALADKPFKAGQIDVLPWHKYLAAAVVDLLALITTKSQNALFYTALFSVILVLAHAALLPIGMKRSISSGVSDIVDSGKSTASNVADAATNKSD